jgi:hypothetical protein
MERSFSTKQRHHSAQILLIWQWVNFSNFPVIFLRTVLTAVPMCPNAQVGAIIISLIPHAGVRWVDNRLNVVTGGGAPE